MPDYSKHDSVLKLLSMAQDPERDNRKLSHEDTLFIEKQDGQWEPEWWNSNAGKPRYTFDMTTTIVNQVAGELEQADFDIQVKPAGGDSTKDDAALFDGLIRNIENISQAKSVFNHAGRNMVTAGIDGWRVVQEYVDDDSFDQDLVIRPIYNFIERVWFDPASQRRDRSDSRYCFVLQAIPRDDYKARFPKGSGQSVNNDRDSSAYYQKTDCITIGQIYFIKQVDREIALMSDGSVHEITEDFTSVLDELALKEITVEKKRKRKKNVVYSRLFDAGGWLSKEQETAFSYVPVIPTYGNFKVIEDKTVYRGVVRKLKDPQRIMNYSLSREIEEGALAPRAKYWMTTTQMKGHESTLQTMNTNADPVQPYNPDPLAPGAPQQNGGAMINPGLQSISANMKAIMGETAGLFAANMGDNPGLQSGVAIERLQNKGDTGTIQYFKAQEIAISHTARILIDAIPRVYDTARKIRILKEDGAFDLTTVNQTIIDTQTGNPVVLNDLSKGKYDVTCSAGPSFQNRQQETVSAITEMAQYDPSILQTSGDILFNNIKAPGMDLIAQRKRQQLLLQGMIPLDQQTDEEQQQLAQIQQQQAGQQDPGQMIAQAELMKAQADAMIAQNKVEETKISVQEKSLKLDLDRRDADRADYKLASDIEYRDDKLDLDVYEATRGAQVPFRPQ